MVTLAEAATAATSTATTTNGVNMRNILHSSL
jgi:hypothetical protein